MTIEELEQRIRKVPGHPAEQRHAAIRSLCLEFAKPLAEAVETRRQYRECKASQGSDEYIDLLMALGPTQLGAQPSAREVLMALCATLAPKPDQALAFDR